MGHSSVSVTESHYIDLLKKDYKDLFNVLNDNFELMDK